MVSTRNIFFVVNILRNKSKRDVQKKKDEKSLIIEEV